LLLFREAHGALERYLPALGDDFHVVCVPRECLVLNDGLPDLPGKFQIVAVVLLLIGGRLVEIAIALTGQSVNRLPPILMAPALPL
jgi:hypothetical protein